MGSPSLKLRAERFYSWRVGTDRGKTERYWSGREGRSTSCDCDWCANWRAAIASRVPTSLRLALRRLGVKLTRESDVYQQATYDMSVLYRAEYTCVGEIHSGPPFWVLEGRAWHPYPWLLRGWPWYLGVGVTTRDESKVRIGRWAPAIPAYTVEVRVALPWVLPKKMPSMYAT